MIKKFLKNHLFLLTSVLVNLFFAFFILLIRGTYYELSDDWYFSVNILKGHYDYTFCSFFIQILTGLIQKVIYPYNAFMILQMGLGFLALTSICYILLDTFKFKKGILFVLIVESVFAINIYSIITFTKTAAFLATAGCLMLLWAYHSKKHIVYSLLGIVFVLFGSFYRFKIFYSVLAVFAFFVFGWVVSEIKKVSVKGIFDALKNVLSVKTVALVLVMLITVFGFDFASKQIIYSGEGMDYYKEYNSLRSSVVDFTMPAYKDEAAEKYESIGISENDFSMLKKWYLDDQGVADIETLTKVLEVQNTENAEWYQVIIKMLHDEFMYVVELTPEGIIILAYIILAAALLFLHKNKSLLLVGSLTLGIVVLYAYLWLGGRSNYRAVFSILFSAIVCLLYSTRFMEYRKRILDIRQDKTILFFLVYALVCIVFSVVFMSFSMTIVTEKLPVSITGVHKKMERFINSSEDKIFALDRDSYLGLRNANKLKHPLALDEAEDAFDKCVYFGSAYFAHPRYNELLENAGIENLYTDIIDNDKIYFVSRGDIKIFIEYLNEQYGDENTAYTYRLVGNAYPYKIYKIITKKDEEKLWSIQVLRDLIDSSSRLMSG